MTRLLRTPCREPGCPHAVRPAGYCQRHKRARQAAYDRRRGTPEQRGYGRAWQLLRRFILARDPICKDCGSRPSWHVDHIVAKKDGGTDDPSNLQGLCRSCHSRKTAVKDGRWGVTA